MGALRVAFVSQSGDVTGGAEESLALLLRHLPAAIDPRVVLFGEGAYARRLRGLGLDVSIVPFGDDVLHATREKFLRTGFGAVSEIGRLRNAFVDLGVDVVHTNSVKAHVLGGTAARLAGLGTVMHLRDILTGTARRVLCTLARACASERIAISRSVADAYALKRTTVIYNPLDLEAYQNMPPCRAARRALDLPETGLVVGLVGRINRWKGHMTFLEVAARLAPRDITFAIVGEARFRDTEFVAELEERARQLELGSRVRFVPWVEDTRTVFAALDVNCNCSTREPLGRTILEAAACGVPSVAFDDGGPAEIVPQSGGIVVPAGDIAAYANAVERLLDTASSGAARDFRRASVKTYDASEHASAVATVLQRVAR
ncbi:MAG: glycosyltransferase [Candidatus Eremiobacteraeota bacterium]|nr:glycosyltransferase [Candidatus Eremiobacteraeota bacterium]